MSSSLSVFDHLLREVYTIMFGNMRLFCDDADRRAKNVCSCIEFYFIILFHQFCNVSFWKTLPKEYWWNAKVVLRTTQMTVMHCLHCIRKNSINFWQSIWHKSIWYMPISDTIPRSNEVWIFPYKKVAWLWSVYHCRITSYEIFSMSGYGVWCNHAFYIGPKFIFCWASTFSARSQS